MTLVGWLNVVDISSTIFWLFVTRIFLNYSSWGFILTYVCLLLICIVLVYTYGNLWIGSTGDPKFQKRLDWEFYYVILWVPKAQATSVEGSWGNQRPKWVQDKFLLGQSCWNEFLNTCISGDLFCHVSLSLSLYF